MEAVVVVVVVVLALVLLIDVAAAPVALEVRQADTTPGRRRPKT